MADSESASGEFTRAAWLAIAVALVGWLAAIYFYTQQNRMDDELTLAGAQRDRVQQELNQQREAAGTVADLNDQIKVLTAEWQNLTARREAAQGDVDTLLQRVEDLRGEESGLQSQIASAQEDKVALEQDLTPLREELATFERRRSDLEQAISAQNAELAQVSGRIEQARSQEAELQQTLSQLTDETARLTKEAASSEASLQEARAELVDITATLEQSRSERDTLRDQISEMQSTATAAEDRLAGLRDDIAATETQRTELQVIRTDLTDAIAQRAQELADLENRIAETMAADTPEPASTLKSEETPTHTDAGGSETKGAEPKGKGTEPKGKRVFEKDSQGCVSVILGVSDPTWRADTDAETEAAAAASV